MVQNTHSIVKLHPRKHSQKQTLPALLILLERIIPSSACASSKMKSNQNLPPQPPQPPPNIRQQLRGKSASTNQKLRRFFPSALIHPGD